MRIMFQGWKEASWLWDRFVPLITLAAALAGIALLTGCTSFPIRSTAIDLPEGDAERGKVAFQQLQCYVCHPVSGYSRRFPEPSAQPPTLVVLGTEDHAPTRRELIDSILNPSHKIYPGPVPQLEKSGNLSRMGDFSETMTVRQLLDVAAFLQSLHKK